MFEFLDTLPVGSIIQSDPDTRVVLKEKKINRKGTETFELLPQIFNEEKGEWEDNNSAVQILTKNKDGSFYGDFTQDFYIFTYTDIKTGKRKSINPKITFPNSSIHTSYYGYIFFSKLFLCLC